MGDLTEAVMDARYRNSFGRIAGYLPENRQAVEAWLTGFAGQALERKEELSSSVAALKQVIKADGSIQMLVDGMLEKLPRQLRFFEGIDHLLKCVDQVITTAPEYHPDPNERILFPLSALFAPLSLTPPGAAVLRMPAFNTALRNVLKAWCVFLDSAQSRYVLTETGNGWLAAQSVEQNKLDQYVIPDRTAEHWGFASFNDFFHRKVKPEARPIATDPNAVIASGDAAYVRVDQNVGKSAGKSAGFPLKGQGYTLAEMFNHHAYADQFIGASVVQLVPPAMGYHRWHSPVDGVVRHVETIPGQVFSVAESSGPALAAQDVSFSAEVAANTRGLIFIESTAPRIGMVALVPVGMSEVSSVTITANQGQEVKKGDEIGYFSYGGSDIVMVFQKQSNVTVLPNADKHYRVGEQIALAHLTS
ncbi:phosphatidylserine decarboxylase family protein [Streptomyces sp. BPTC-684]|uniref:phosphatidylserine decarboxylase family protein n=1 Tax=Streptomyces sp. BPTC-684 TaxID=3043734 RepID=UPI0024B0FCD7|nr:phosphatidylserine decarboxylase family protein [Streptomyces sp. BPTC-684]WHM40737.1 phophatidylserine decarboxylase associated domain-containing protein [Streptomyces sp. BPTC-684]